MILASGGIASIVGTVLLCKYFSDIKDSHVNECRESHPDSSCHSSDVDKGEGLGFAGSVIGGALSSFGLFGSTFWAHNKRCEIGELIANRDQEIEAHRTFRNV